MHERRFVAQCMKRIVDLTLGLVVSIVLLPVIAAVAITIRIVMHESALFTQQRPGRHGQLFTLWKFRSMRTAVGPEGILPDAQRLTRLGLILRETSLDEVPQLWNVLRGEMSLVGPRPMLMKYLDRYTPEQARRHEVLPGITGWAQVNGRNELSWEEKFKLDVWYVDHWSLKLDLQILSRTLVVSLAQRGISNDAHATMPEFLGITSAPESGNAMYRPAATFVRRSSTHPPALPIAPKTSETQQ
jgi:lipopolysaccharide/colanic/teichoic acid biosynthesis glycosyltransferase